jgi:hypothetical protein
MRNYSAFGIQKSSFIRPSDFLRHSSFELRHLSANANRFGSHLSSRGYTFVLVVVGAAEERDLIEHVLLEPFQPEVDHWRDE